MNPNEHDTDNQFADLAQIADQDDDSAEELQFTADEIRQLRAEGENRRIEELKLGFQMFSYLVSISPNAERVDSSSHVVDSGRKRLTTPSCDRSPLIAACFVPDRMSLSTNPSQRWTPTSIKKCAPHSR